MTERGLANLVAFTRRLGYVRWFHPGDGVEPTRAGVAAGRDELLERALEVVTRAPARP